MNQTVAVIDHGMGNLRSVCHALQAAAADLRVHVVLADRPEQLRDAHRLVLPGQGAMGDCMGRLQERGLADAIVQAVHDKPLLGVCIGMQMLLQYSEEGRSSAGTDCLGLLPGQVRRFRLAGLHDTTGRRYKLPQIGWNQVRQLRPHALWRGIADDSWFYFVHSLHACPDDAADCVGETEYGICFASAIARDNLFAAQFHPEKSAAQGIALYRNFLRWAP